MLLLYPCTFYFASGFLNSADLDWLESICEDSSFLPDSLVDCGVVFDDFQALPASRSSRVGELSILLNIDYTSKCYTNY